SPRDILQGNMTVTASVDWVSRHQRCANSATRKQRREDMVPAPSVLQTANYDWLLRGQCRLGNFVNAVPRRCGLQSVVHVRDVLYALVLQPRFKCLPALFGEDWNAVFPSRAAAKHAIELHAGFRGKLEVFDELGVADASRQVD